MSILTALAVAGIGLTVVFGIWAVYLIARRKYPGRITFIKEQSIGLFDTIVKNLPELNVFYKDSPVAENLVLLRGALLNTGRIDITPPMVEVPITIELPEGYNWITAKVISASDDVNASLSLGKSRNLIIKMGLFRTKEYIRFQALAEVPADNQKGGKISHAAIGEKLETALQFTHRIANTRHVDKQKVVDTTALEKRRISLAALFGVMCVGVAIIIVSLVTGIPGDLCYSYIPEEGKVLRVRIKPYASGSVKVNGIEQKYTETLQADNFFSKCQGTPSIIGEAPPRVFFLFLTLVVYVVLPLVYLLFVFRSHRQNRKLRRMLELEA